MRPQVGGRGRTDCGLDDPLGDESVQVKNMYGEESKTIYSELRVSPGEGLL